MFSTGTWYRYVFERFQFAKKNVQYSKADPNRKVKSKTKSTASFTFERPAEKTS